MERRFIDAVSWRRRARTAVALTVSALTLACTRAAEAYYVIPYKVDPPIQVDGALGDWDGVPNAIEMRDASHQTYHSASAGPWAGVADLSATVRLSWRPDGLYVAAEVTDDTVQQPYSGRDVWKGDYVNLWLDFIPTAEPTRQQLGPGQYHIGISPGNFGGRAGGEGNTPPSVFFFMPQNLPMPDAQARSRLTGNGYTLEAYIPFSAMPEAGQIAQNRHITFEIAVSDSDGRPAAQDRLMTAGTEEWALNRLRLLPALFGDGNGQAEVPGKDLPLGEDVTFEKPGRRDYTVDLESVGEEMAALLCFRARSQTERAAGYCNWAMAVEVNGVGLLDERLVNRPAVMRDVYGHELTVVSVGGELCVAHQPDWTSTDQDKGYRVPGVKVSEFEFSLQGLLKPGSNTISILGTQRQWQEKYPTIVVGDLGLRIRPRRPGDVLLAPAPTGDLPVCEPALTFPATYGNLVQDDARIALTVGGQAVPVVSRYSSPDGQWNTGSTRYFTHRRDVEPHDQWLIVRDTFTNLTDENLPLMYGHTVALGEKSTRVWIGGRPVGTTVAGQAEAGNPSVLAAFDAGAVGLVALNDVFRVHVEQRAVNGDVDLMDPHFVLQPEATYTAEWAIVPVTEPSLWTFVNTARRMLDANFTLNILFAFAMKEPPVYDWSDATFRRFVENKSANFIVQSNYLVTHNGNPARCTAWNQGPHTAYKDMNKKIRRLYPDRSVKHGIYYHCFLDTWEANAERFPDDRGLDAAGNHIRYGGGRHSYMTLFAPTLENDWGREIERTLTIILDEIGADGVFWDEFTRSKVDYVYGDLWDGCSADIDPKTCDITRLKCSLTLKSLPFRLKQVRRILDAGKWLLVNGAPHTRTMADLKFQAFTETGNIVNCRKMLLHSPVALGDHLTERTPEQAYRVMLRALDHGCLYAWYQTAIVPRHPMLTEHMFPFTPIELHEGYVIGRERIVTNRSGRFGWGDASAFVAHVYDRTGKETDRYPVKAVEQDGKTYADVRIPGGYSAAIVRIGR